MRIFYWLVILLLTGYTNAFSQTVKISGQVKTKKDSALAGATVVIKGTARSVVADSNGAFLIKKVKLPAVLVFSADGCKTKEVDLSKEDTTRYLSVTLLVVSEELAEARHVAAEKAKRMAELRAKSDRLIAKMKSSPPPAPKA
ncbi:MAG TPA: carboxypeptidase-like regulatory domain-containing protein, partial [Niastella sp.]